VVTVLGGRLPCDLRAVLASTVASMDVAEGVWAAMDRLGLAYELIPCDPELADTAAFCVAYGFGLDESANTIVVAGKATPPVYAACVVLATHRLDVNGLIRHRLGTRKASFASADETSELTGMLIGGVTPFGLPGDLAVWIDAAVMAKDKVIVGGGSRHWKIRVSPGALVVVPTAEVVDGLAVAAGRRPDQSGRE
jgi:prolyl-tRNA editing enzyme YbaK/EbsC (Cys-tRNA(Pro) deacylase)